MTNQASEELYGAVCDNQWGKANALVAGGAVPDKKTLTHAAEWRPSNWTTMLVKAGGKPTPDMLYKAVCDNKWEIANALVAGHAVPDNKTLTHAAEWRPTKWTTMLVKAGGKPTADMLYKAVCDNKWEIANALVAGHAVPDNKTLTHAAQWRPTKWTTMLVKAGGKPTADMLYKAVCDNKWEIANALVAGHDVPDNKTLTHAAQWRTPNWTTMLVKAVEDSKHPVTQAAQQATPLTPVYNKSADEEAKEKAEMLEIVHQMQRELGKSAARPARPLMTLKG